MTFISLVPSASRLMASLRDLGYELPQAVAELIDNSIDADATEVDVDLRFDGVDSWLRVVDNGHGMTGPALDESMRFGSSRDYRAGSLGGFGLGLKTASFSQCRRLSIASRRSPERRRIEVRRWDLDEIDTIDDWLLERVAVPDAPELVVDPLADHAGTVVLWESLDRVLLYRNPGGGHAENAMNSLRAELEQHLSMVFHRFLAGEARREIPLTIRVNGDALEPWDPYARAEDFTRELPTTTLDLPHEGRTHQVVVRPYLLPSQQRFSTPEAHRVAGGARKWNRQQGLYIYREDRLIQSGGWNRLRTQDEHTKLARIGIDLPREADELFGVNVSKMRVTLPESLRPALRALATAVTSQAQENYRERNEKPERTTDSKPASAATLAALFDIDADFIPRARVVELLRSTLADADELRTVVNAILIDDWKARAIGAQSENRPSALDAEGSAAGMA
jgi:hypothetical protein